MKLAEALLLRADMQKKLASLRERIGQNAVVQEGEAPHEDPDKLLHQAFGVLSDLQQLVAKVNAANMASKLPDGRALAVAIGERDTLVRQHALISAAIDASKKEPDRYSVREIKWVATLDVAKLQRQLEDLAKQIRELNALIQQANWGIDLS
ncbi:MAG: DIP1984 family protein [Planctomycetes bacterium]|nr:DIP1984 family protein [Planctomycetota bacterium]